jgi:iron complex transport system substrate-binding protein
MSKWWLLSAGLVLWLASGYALLGHPEANTVRARVVCAQEAPRIVTLAPNLTEILFALGLGGNVVGLTQDSDYPPAALDKPHVGTFWQPSIEAVIATRPDLVVTLALEQQKELARRLARMGYDCLTVDIERPAGLFPAIDAIGEATGARGQARELSARIQEEIRRLRTLVAGTTKVKVLWVVQREPLRVAGRDTFINEMIELAGGENAIGMTLHKYPPVGAEQVIAAGPEVIIEPVMGQGPAGRQREQALSYWSRYANVPAVANRRIYVVDGDVVSRLGPRLPVGIEVIAKCLRPELFGE